VNRGSWFIARAALCLAWVLVAAVAAGAFDFGGATSAAPEDGGIVLAVAQVVPSLDKAANLDLVESLIIQAASVGADVLVMPELATTAYPWGTDEDVRSYLASNAEPIPGGETPTRLAELARAHEMVLCFGMVEADPGGDEIYNSMVLIDADGELRGVYRKVHLVPGIEEALFVAGDRIEVHDTAVGSIGIMVCYDRRFPELGRTYALLGARILAVGAASADEFVDTHILATRAYENAAWLLFANQAGHPAGGQASPMHGGSRIVDPNGRIRAEATGEGNELVWLRVDREELATERRLLGAARPDVYAQVPAMLWATADEAAEIATRALELDETPDVAAYILPRRLDAGETVVNWGGAVRQVDAASWLVFIDDQPGANWEHPCRFAFVDALTRELVVVEATSPPQRFAEMQRL